MKRGREAFRSLPRRQEVGSMEDILEQAQRSGHAYFVKTLTRTAIETRNNMKQAMLSLPAKFVRENGEKIEQWVTLRTHISPARSGRPWTVRLSASTDTGRVLLCGGFYAFVTANHLRAGDSLVFVLQENLRSEFEVYKFRGPQGVPLHQDDESDYTSSDAETNGRSSYPGSPSHHQTEVKKVAFTRDTWHGQATPSWTPSRAPSQNVHAGQYFDYHRVHKQVPTRDCTTEGIRRVAPPPPQPASHFDYRRRLRSCKVEPTSDSMEGRDTPSLNASHFDHHRVRKKEPANNYTREWRKRRMRIPSEIGVELRNDRVIPFFRKRLTASNIGRSDRDPRTNSGQFELPERFLRTHARLIQNNVKLQGIYEYSRTHVITCRRRPGNRLRVDFLVTDWSRFVKENRLERGQELQFSLMANSYFLVRKVY